MDVSNIFFALIDLKFQLNLIHCLLIRELSHFRKDELLVRVNGFVLKFGVVEFSLVTGLNCNVNVGVGVLNIPKINGGLFDILTYIFLVYLK